MKNTIFEGTATALITPFSSDGKDVDFNAFQKLIDFQLENSVDALVVAGTTGESPVLTREEKICLIRSAKCSCGSSTPVIAGTGSNNTIEAVKKSNDAEKEGVDGLLIVTPYYNKCTDEGLIRHYYYIADRVSVPIIVYNVPSRTGVNIKPEIYNALAEHKNIVGIKEASGNISSFVKTSALCRNKISLYSGNDDQIVSMMAEGADGVISVASNILPSVFTEIARLCLNGDFDTASDIHKRYLNLINLLFSEVNPIPIKYACNYIFGLNNSLRLPLTEITAYNKSRITEEIDNLKIVI